MATTLQTKDSDGVSISPTLVSSRPSTPSFTYKQNNQNSISTATIAMDSSTEITPTARKWAPFLVPATNADIPTEPESKKAIVTSSYTSTPALAAVSTAIFEFLDATFQPRNTGVIEPRKLQACKESLMHHKTVVQYPSADTQSPLSPTIDQPLLSEKPSTASRNPITLFFGQCLGFDRKSSGSAQPAKKRQRRRKWVILKPQPYTPPELTGMTLEEFIKDQELAALEDRYKHMRDTRELLFFIRSHLEQQETWRSRKEGEVQTQQLGAGVPNREEYTIRRNEAGRKGWHVWEDAMGWWGEVVVRGVNGATIEDGVVAELEEIPGEGCWGL
ncbi:hypothetical protein DFH27DRAFT_366848 [Peziza echinospora]|nr:hypothetical protein DFH27DRAFT_366848 [Peziza echinospora]